MGKAERKAYLEAIWKRYRESDRRGKTAILDEFCEVCGYHRKVAIGLLNAAARRPRPGTARKATAIQPRKPGPTRKFGQPHFQKALEKIWKAAGYPCGKRLAPILEQWLPFVPELAPRLRAQLATASPATLERLLTPMRRRLGHKGACGTRPGTLLRTEIPIRTGNWDVDRPGFVEADTVAHCGGSLAGSFAWSLTLTDIHTGWTENRAVWDKGAAGVVDAVRDIESSLPFPLLGFDCDNGSEFLNHHLVRYFADRPSAVGMTRSRPYKKNDNAHVEQKNWTHVRQLLGYARIQAKEALVQMNDLYHFWSLYQNHFIATMKLKEKTRVGAKYRRKYPRPETPYFRCIQSQHIGKARKAMLEKEHKGLNPFTLKTLIEQKIRLVSETIRVMSNLR